MRFKKGDRVVLNQKVWYHSPTERRIIGPGTLGTIDIDGSGKGADYCEVRFDFMYEKAFVVVPEGILDLATPLDIFIRGVGPD